MLAYFLFVVPLPAVYGWGCIELRISIGMERGNVLILLSVCTLPFFFANCDDDVEKGAVDGMHGG